MRSAKSLVRDVESTSQFSLSGSAVLRFLAWVEKRFYGSVGLVNKRFVAHDGSLVAVLVAVVVATSDVSLTVSPGSNQETGVEYGDYEL